MQHVVLFFTFSLSSQEISSLQQPKLPSAFMRSILGFVCKFQDQHHVFIHQFLNYMWHKDFVNVHLNCFCLSVLSFQKNSGWLCHTWGSKLVILTYLFFIIRQSAIDNCNIKSPLLLCLPALTHKVSAGSLCVPSQTSMHSCFSHSQRTIPSFHLLSMIITTKTLFLTPAAQPANNPFSPPWQDWWEKHPGFHVPEVSGILFYNPVMDPIL